MSDESDENQTELYHFARGAFVDTDWFPGDLDENDDVVRVSEAGQFPESYYLEEGDWGAAPLVPGDDPPYEGVISRRRSTPPSTGPTALSPARLAASRCGTSSSASRNTTTSRANSTRWSSSACTSTSG